MDYFDEILIISRHLDIPSYCIAMAPLTDGITSHSSSTSLSIALLRDIIDTPLDDVAITKELLTRPKIPVRQTSFLGTSQEQQAYEDDSLLDGADEPQPTKRSRRVIVQSSNTWTSASGELHSEHDEIDDRDAFVREYNRLARKV